MNQDVQKLASDLEEKIAELNQQAETAEHRKEVAVNVASSLEERNQQKIAIIEKEAENLRNKLAREREVETAKYNQQISKLESVKQSLQKDIQKLLADTSNIELEKDSLEKIQTDTKDKIRTARTRLSNLDKEIREAQELLTDRLGKIEVHKQTVGELEFQLEQLRNDKETLQNEVDVVVNDLTEAHSQFDNQKQNLEDEIYTTRQKLDKAFISLREAESKDKAFRQDWAKEKLELDKRMAVVKRAESKLLGVESRIEELQRYDTL